MTDGSYPYLRQSGMMLSKVLKLVPPLLVREVQVTLLALKGTKQSYVAILLEMEQKGLDYTRNLLGLVHKLFLSYCAPFLSRE